MTEARDWQRFEPLPRNSYDATADQVAPQLLGHWLIRQTPEGFSGGPIVEVEAYLADDPGCHAFSGETKRNRTMFGEQGRAYVYLIYGYHYCVNAVCRPHGIGEAVLIRAIAPAFGEIQMRQRRPVARDRDLSSGPAKLCQAMQIDRELDGVDLCAAQSPLFIARNERVDEFLEKAGPIVTTTRIGISKAAHLPLRFCVNGSPYLSRRAVAP